jgi:hypothetical protein
MTTASRSILKMVLASSATLLLVSSVLTGCKEDEAPPPLPSAAPPPPPAAPVELAPEPAAPIDAGVDAGKKRTGTGSSLSLKKCCDALRQNAANAPPPNNEYMLAAAGTCDGLVAMGRDKGSIVGAVQAALRGAGMPAACK